MRIGKRNPAAARALALGGPMLGMLTLGVLTLGVLTLGGWGCAGKGLSAEPPVEPAPISRSPAAAPGLSNRPLSTPQTRAELPPPQPIPPGAAPPPSDRTVEVAQPPPPLTEPAEEPPVRVARPRPRPPVPLEQPAETPRPPQLGPILSAGERRTYNREIDQNVLATRRLLASLTPRALDANQHAAVKRIRAFLSQAGETREQDLARSMNLAQRARVLAEDLERSTR